MELRAQSIGSETGALDAMQTPAEFFGVIRCVGSFAQDSSSDMV
jgi:hypothetical protein